MEKEHEFYRSLCSAETLRSGKKGFFHDFTESVMNAAGDSWTVESFARLRDDRERLRIVFTDPRIKDDVVGVLARVQPLYRDKDAEAAKKRRLEGFQMAAAGQHEKALLLLSQAVLRAPVTGKCKNIDAGYSLPLALMGRAEIFVSLNEYALALEDLKMARENDLPNKLKTELDRKRKECESFLNKNEMALVPMASSESTTNGVDVQRILQIGKYTPPVAPPLTGGTNSEIPEASAFLGIRDTTTAGKEAVAIMEIHPGDSLVVEPPIAGCLLPEFYGTHCHHCYSRLRAPVGCPDCSTVAFCGRECRDEAFATYHKYECKILALLIGSGMSVLSTVAFRMVTQLGVDKCLKICNALERKLSSKNEQSETGKADSEDSAADPALLSKMSKSARRRLRKKKLKESREPSQTENSPDVESTILDEQEEETLDLRVYGLVTHETKRSPKDFLERSLMAAFLLKCLQRVSFFRNPSRDQEPPSEEEISVGGLLLKNLQLLQFNAHEFFETRQGGQHRFRGSRPVYLGVAIYPTVARFNHECYPAVTRYFAGRNIVIRAIRSLKPGDVIAENYGPIFTKRSLEDRQRSLSGRYWFQCTCRPCRENWPSFETLTNEPLRLRCPTKNCNGVHSCRREISKPQKCPSCRKSVDLSGRLLCVEECEEFYTRGLAKMDEERVEEAIEILSGALKKFHEVASAPHRDTQLAEIALAACMADAGNTWRVPSSR